MKMKRYFYFMLSFALCGGIFCASCSKPGDEADLIIKSSDGDIYVKLSDQTPKHKANFLSLIDNGYFKNAKTFFRVIADAVAQGGGQPFYPDNDPRNFVDPEITSELIHRKGAFCAPRFPDEMNPDRKSSGSQFYIVLGKKFTDEELDETETFKTQALKLKTIFDYKRKHQQQLFTEYQASPQGKWTDSTDLARLRQSDPKAYERLSNRINDGIDSLIWIQKLNRKAPTFKFTDLQRKTYREIGGLPDLDGDYTVMGEVVLGLEIAEKISRTVTELNSNTPAEPVTFKIVRNEK